MARLLGGLIGLAVALVIGAVVVSSVLADARMLVDAGGWYMLGLYLVVPSLVALHAFLGR
jgi:hypothetical protein